MGPSSTDDEAVLHAALRYAQMGYPVFPVDPESKAPKTTHGVYDATLDPDVVKQLFRGGVDDGVAIRTDGMVVIDIDDPSSPWLREAGMPEALAACPIAQTPRGGSHHYYRRHAGFVGKNWNGLIAPGIDLKTDGGYVVAPPTTGQLGAYRWHQGDLAQIPRDQLPPLPPEILRHVERVAERMELGIAHSESLRLSGVALTVPEGTRNTWLTSLAGRLRRQGMSRNDIARELHAMNQQACQPPLPDVEVEKIADSVGRYAVGPFSRIPPVLRVPRLPFQAVWDTPEDGREVLIEGIARRADVVNLVGVTKSGKSLMVAQLAMQMALGVPWLGVFATRRGRTLIIDAEVGAAVLRDRFRALAASMGQEAAAFTSSLEVVDLRGVYDQPEQCHATLESLRPGELDLVIVDPLYRVLPDGTDENNNLALGSFYRLLSSYACSRGFVCVVVHHTPKLVGPPRSVTDAGAGAGSISRAADGQLVFGMKGKVPTLQGAFRGFPEFKARRLEWRECFWTVTGFTDGEAKTSEGKLRHPKPLPMSADAFIEQCVSFTPESEAVIVQRANALGQSRRHAKDLLRTGTESGAIEREQTAGNRPATFRRSPSDSEPLQESARARPPLSNPPVSSGVTGKAKRRVASTPPPSPSPRRKTPH